MFTDWPPGPDERLTSIRRSLSSSMSTSTSSASGITIDRRGRGVDPAARLGRRDALHAVDAALELEPAVGAVAADLDDRLLDPVDAGLVEAEHLGRVAMATCVAQVHPEDLRREQGGLIAAGAGTDLEDDVALVVRVARQQKHSELLEEPALLRLRGARSRRAPSPACPRRRRPRREPRAPRQARRGSPCSVRKAATVGSSRASSRPSLRSSFGSAVTSGRASSALRSSYCAATSTSLASRSLMTTAGGSSVVATATGSPVSFGVSPDGSTSGSRSKSVEPTGIGLPSAVSASCIDEIATSIMSSVGRFVVIIWTRIPGNMIARTMRLCRNFAPSLRTS